MARTDTLPTMASFGRRTVHLLAASCVGLSATLGSAVALALFHGCSSAPQGTPVYDEEDPALPAVPKGMRVVSSFGGAHRTLEVSGTVWYQSFVNRVLLLDAQTGTLVSDIEVAPRGTTGPVVDLLLRGTRLFVVLEDDAVVELDVTAPRLPTFVARWSRPALGLAPRTLSLVDERILVSGAGGVVHLAEVPSDAALAVRITEPTTAGEPNATLPDPPARQLEGMEVGSVVAAADGAVACVGRRILRVADGTYLGAASVLLPLPQESGGGYGFALQASEGAEVGLMGLDFRKRSSSGVRGKVHSIRFYEGRLFAVTESEIASWRLDATAGSATTVQGEGTQLGALAAIPVKGAMDVAWVKRNRFAVSGTFGRALYRYLPEGEHPGDDFYWTQRMPGRLDVSVTDRRRILAVGAEGAWMYLIGENAELTDRPIASPDLQSATAETAWGSASCDDERLEVVFRVGDRAVSYFPSRDGKVSTLAAADGKIWIGHDHGIDVVGYDPLTGEIVAEDRIVLAGPIIAIYPARVGGGVNYVARFDGFGVIRPIAITAPPVQSPGSLRGYLDPSTPTMQVTQDPTRRP